VSTDFHRVLLASLLVSEGVDARRRDYEDKRRDYQRASIAEYWIVDPEDRKITVLVLENSLYPMHGEFGPGQSASGILVPDLVVAVDEIFNLGRNQPGIKSTDDLHVNEG
jgi:Uma2 family endonuclease